MTFQQAENLLVEFPNLFKVAVNQRNNALHGGCRDMTRGRCGSGGHADPTANKALRLAETNGIIKLLAVVRRWLNTHLPPEDRRLLIETWRHSNWWQIARRCKQGVLLCQNKWNQMVQRLKAYVGTALKRDGAAFAHGLTLSHEA